MVLTVRNEVECDMSFTSLTPPSEDERDSRVWQPRSLALLRGCEVIDSPKSRDGLE